MAKSVSLRFLRVGGLAALAVRADINIKYAIRLLVRLGARRASVTRDSEVVGFVSQRDMVELYAGAEAGLGEGARWRFLRGGFTIRLSPSQLKRAAGKTGHSVTDQLRAPNINRTDALRPHFQLRLFRRPVLAANTLQFFITVLLQQRNSHYASIENNQHHTYFIFVISIIGNGPNEWLSP
ncbi:MAG: hypothetical protein K0U74_08665 [Alphaproteobacteria bacterium]|nr:hypothetical protein [Alphaproteobacteria bacterium]